MWERGGIIGGKVWNEWKIMRLMKKREHGHCAQICLIYIDCVSTTYFLSCAPISYTNVCECVMTKKNETSTLIVLKVLSSQMSVFLCDMRCSEAPGPAGGSRVRWGGRWALPAAQRGGRLPAPWWCLLWSAGEGSHQRLGSTPRYLPRMTLESKTASQETGGKAGHGGKSHFLHFHFAQKYVKHLFFWGGKKNHCSVQRK